MQAEDVAVVIPSYNEGGGLRHVVEGVLAYGYRVIVVDDGSTEPAERWLSGLSVHVLRHGINLGQGAALQTGMDFARRLGAAAVVHFDADGQHGAADIPRFLNALDDGADVVLGSRFMRQQDIAEVPRGKRLMLRMARVVNGVFTGLWLTDAHNGFRALNRRALERIDLRENRMAHATEILGQIRQAGLTVKELPVTVRYTEYSRAKGQRWTNSLNILIDLILEKLF